MPSFPAQGYINLADILLSANEESALRSAASRAYYGVFHAAREHVQSQGGFVPRTQAHAYVWDELRRTDRALGRLGRRLRDNRNKADYDATISRLHDLAVMTVRDAKVLKAKIASLP